MKTCQTCTHGYLKTMTVNTPINQDWRCYRIRRMRDTKSPDKGFLHPGAWGSSCSFERDTVQEPHRVNGDKCGPDGIHWEART